MIKNWLLNSKLFLPLTALFIYSQAYPLYGKKIRSAVTYEFSGGRMGDNLIAYLHAKWISYKYDIPLLYRPFPYSDQFRFDDIELRYQERFAQGIQHHFYLGRNQTVIQNRSLIGLYIVPYFPESTAERIYFRDGQGNHFPYFKVDWKDPGFRKIALEMLTPKIPVQVCDCPKDKTTIAVHVRTGGGFDDSSFAFKQPLKCPPMSFYLEQLQSICQIFPTEELYFHIFTDDAHPEKIAQCFDEFIGEDRISFSYRKEDNWHDQNVLEDLFSMMQFDCLIRPESNYSILASLLKDYQVLLHPGNFTYFEGIPSINRTEIVIN